MANPVLSEPLQRFVVRLAWASLVPAAMLVAAMLLKPMWRDEFWSLYFTEPRFSMEELLNGRMRYETHPPLYFVFLRLWRGIADNAEWIRTLAIPFLVTGALGAWLIGRGRRELGLFLLMCVGSYWVIYFVTEARPYTLLFVLCAWSTLVLVKLVDDRASSPIWYGLWAIVGALIGLSHYFGGLWVGSLGLVAGIVFLMQKRYGAFFGIGIASVVAVAPILYWLVTSMPMLGERGGNPPPDADEWQTFLKQLLRGLTVKLLGSNLAITCLVFAGVAALWRSRAAIDRVIVYGTLLFIALCAALDLFYSPMIKERSFTPMIPAIIFLMARAVLSVEPERKWARRFLVAAPILAVISPFLFIPEYFKDRERLGEMREWIRTEAGDCAGSPVITFMRPRWNDDTYQREVIAREMRLAVPGREPLVLSTTEVTGPVEANPACRLRGMALTLRPGDRPEHEDIRNALSEAGLDLDSLEEIGFGNGRSRIWVTPEAPPQAPASAP